MAVVIIYNIYPDCEVSDAKEIQVVDEEVQSVIKLHLDWVERLISVETIFLQEQPLY